MKRITRRLFFTGLASSRLCIAEAASAEADLKELAPQIFARINVLRARVNAPPLAWDSALAREARRESEDMARLGFFSHVNPERGDLGARLREVGIRWWRCAENILRENRFDDPVSVAEVEWWYSLPHRENLVNPVYTRTGVGLARASDDTVFATQMFLTPLPPGMRRRGLNAP